MPLYRIVIAGKVAPDLDAIFEYIARQSPETARRVVARILKSMDGLKRFPHRTIISRQRKDHPQPVRSLPIQSWVIFFRVDDVNRVVRVLRVRHGRQRRPRSFE